MLPDILIFLTHNYATSEVSCSNLTLEFYYNVESLAVIEAEIEEEFGFCVDSYKENLMKVFIFLLKLT